jgi:putative transposase
MFLSYQYRLSPLPDQLLVLGQILRELTAVWNHALAERVDAWRKEHRSVTYLDQETRLQRWRAFDRYGLGTVAYSIAQAHLQRLDLSYREFFRRIERRKVGGRVPRVGYPRFHRETTSFSFQAKGGPIARGPHETWQLKVPSLGGIPVRFHRPFPPKAVVKSVTVAREGNRWYATLQLEVPDPAPPPATEPTSPVGIDLGVTSLATLSDGAIVERPKFVDRAAKSLAHHQRILSRRQRGSHRYQIQKNRVAKCQARTRHQRQALLHQLSHDWSEQYDLVAFEDLDAAELIEGNPLAKGISEAGWGQLRQMTAYKQALRSHQYLEVPSRGTTQTCSKCGRRAEPPLTLKDRSFACPCGFTEDRDQNASRNILARGLTLLKELRARCSEVMRVEEGPPPRRGRQAYQRRRAPPEKREEIGPPRDGVLRKEPRDVGD